VKKEEDLKSKEPTADQKKKTKEEQPRRRRITHTADLKKENPEEATTWNSWLKTRFSKP